LLPGLDLRLRPARDLSLRLAQGEGWSRRGLADDGRALVPDLQAHERGADDLPGGARDVPRVFLAEDVLEAVHDCTKRLRERGQAPLDLRARFPRKPRALAAVELREQAVHERCDPRLAYASAGLQAAGGDV
jgi:hypothetical protein